MAGEPAELIRKIRENIGTAFVGNDTMIDRVICCLIAEGHLLLEDVPGVGKTTLALALARSIQCSFGRVSFSPDTLPSDITGLSVFDRATGEFVFKPGPVLNNIFLADEINRTPPKTQSALLEVMQEKKVTADGASYPIDGIFMVIATQNPVEFAGTYPLPEAQLDRFMMKISLGYPSREDELRLAGNIKDVSRLDPVCSVNDIVSLQDKVKNVRVADNVLNYIYNIVDATRKERRFVLGASPRALLALVQASRANALLNGRDFTKPDDVKAMYMPVLLHRLILSVEARMAHEDAATILRSLVSTVEVPITPSGRD
ncbi:MAG: MoxR family ATPase [Lachnospiraceae bacterium]|nr:MoxR family ATPase [Lachnospiraceae bacterium]